VWIRNHACFVNHRAEKASESNSPAATQLIVKKTGANTSGITGAGSACDN